jgi:uncharacterized membrane-anchored protein YhcB (DUF1043 family)
MNRWKLAALGLGVMGLVGFVIARRTSEASSRAHCERDSAEDLSRQVEALRREVGELRANSPSRVYVVTQPARPHVETTPPASAPDTTTAPPPNEEERHQQTADELDARFTGEAKDRGWSFSTIRQIREAIASLTPSSRVLEADCASTLCRVVLGHDSDDDQRRLAFVLPKARPFQEGVFYHYDRTPTALKTTLYVLREHHSFGEESDPSSG